MTKQEVIRLVHPKYQNQTQRIGFFVAIATSILLVVLHNPFGGYGAFVIDCCAPLSQFCFCTNDGDFYPISEWLSLDPVVVWFGPVLHLIISVLATLAAGLIWLFTFATPPEN